MKQSIFSLKDKIKFIGRTLFYEEKVKIFYSAAGMEFNAEIVGDLKLTLKASRINHTKSGGIYFKVFINDKFTKNIHITDEKENEVILAENLKGEYNIRLIRETAFVWGEVELIALNLNGKLKDKPKDKELFIEFIGDSITCGYGLQYRGQKTIDNDRPSISYATSAYAYKTAKALNADYSIISQSGIGVYVGYVREYNMREIYSFICKRFSDELYSFSKSPDFVVINLGTNDVGANDDLDHKSLSEIKEGFIAFLKTVKEKNPLSKIVWCYGMMRNEYNDIIKEVVKEMGGKENNLYSFHLPRNNEGFRWHPNIKGQTAAAKALSEYLKRI